MGRGVPVRGLSAVNLITFSMMVLGSVCQSQTPSAPFVLSVPGLPAFPVQPP